MNDHPRCYCLHCVGKFLKMLGEYLINQNPQCTHRELLNLNRMVRKRKFSIRNGIREGMRRSGLI